MSEEEVGGDKPNDLQDELARARALQKGISLSEATVSVVSTIEPATKYRFKEAETNNRVYEKEEVTKTELSMTDVYETLSATDEFFRNNDRRIVVVNKNGTRDGATLPDTRAIQKISNHAERIPSLGVSAIQNLFFLSQDDNGAAALECEIKHTVLLDIEMPLLDDLKLASVFENGSDAALCAHKLNHALSSDSVGLRQYEEKYRVTVQSSVVKESLISPSEGRGRSDVLQQLARQPFAKPSNRQDSTTYVFTNTHNEKEEKMTISDAVRVANEVQNKRQKSEETEDPSPEEPVIKEQQTITLETKTSKNSLTLEANEVDATWEIQKTDNILPMEAVDFFERTGFDAAAGRTLRLRAIKTNDAKEIKTEEYPVLTDTDDEWMLIPSQTVLDDFIDDYS